ncbi:MAG: Txe/YoeB family addiction module toxin [Oscillospiraceae bacterium]|nr:Txe/YoeB family addiction module toxin [Oscillospiraceae bacterium]
MGKTIFDDRAWDDYVFWQGQDRKTLKRINNILQSISRDPFGGIGKAEKLKSRPNSWSRRIDECNRLVYTVEPSKTNPGEVNIEVIQCKGHYDD